MVSMELEPLADVPKLRRLTGKQVISILEHCGFHIHAQKGSHAKLRRVGPDGEQQTLTVPMRGEA